MPKSPQPLTDAQIEQFLVRLNRTRQGFVFIRPRTKKTWCIQTNYTFKDTLLTVSEAIRAMAEKYGGTD